MNDDEARKPGSQARPYLFASEIGRFGLSSGLKASPMKCGAGHAGHRPSDSTVTLQQWVWCRIG
jgi:hypothetical protein